MEKIIEFFNKAKMFFIATIDENNYPRVRPFGGLLEYEGKLYFNTNNTKKVYSQLINNPKIELCAFSEGKWMRVEAHAIQESSLAVKDAMLKAQPHVAKMYKDKENIFEIFGMEKVTAVLHSFGKEEIIYKD